MKTSKNKIIIGLLASSFLMTNSVNYSSVGSCHASTWNQEETMLGSITLNHIPAKENKRISIIIGKLLSLNGTGEPFDLGNEYQFEQFSEIISNCKICKLDSSDKTLSCQDKLAIIANIIHATNDISCIVSAGKFGAQGRYETKWLNQTEDKSLQMIADKTKLDTCLITVHDGKLTCPYFLKGFKCASPTKEIYSKQLGFTNYHDDEIVEEFSKYFYSNNCGENLFNLEIDSDDIGSDFFKHAHLEENTCNIIFIKDETKNQLYLLFKSNTYPQELQILKELHRLKLGNFSKAAYTLGWLAIFTVLIASGYYVLSSHASESGTSKELMDVDSPVIDNQITNTDLSYLKIKELQSKHYDYVPMPKSTDLIDTDNPITGWEQPYFKTKDLPPKHYEYEPIQKSTPTPVPTSTPPPKPKPAVKQGQESGQTQKWSTQGHKCTSDKCKDTHASKLQGYNRWGFKK